jgi:predicted Zn-dependent protease
MKENPRATLPAEAIELLQVLGFLHLQSNRAPEAVALLEAADHASGCEGRALVLLALAQLRSGTAGRALATLDRADRETAAWGTYQVVRAQVLSDLGRHEQASQTLRAYASTQAQSTRSRGKP